MAYIQPGGAFDVTVTIVHVYIYHNMGMYLDTLWCVCVYVLMLSVCVYDYVVLRFASGELGR